MKELPIDFIKIEQQLQVKEIITDSKGRKREKNLTTMQKKKIYAFMAGFWPDIILRLAAIPLKRNPDGKVSPSATLKAIEDPNIKAALRVIAKETARAAMMTTTQPRYCSLVPIFMSAHKEYNNVMYEEWDKTDELINYVVGHKLWKDIEPWLNTNGLLAKVPRSKALTDSSGVLQSGTWYPKSRLVYGQGEDDIFKGGNLMRVIYFQQWMANVENRNKYMILDSMNWDRMPEPLDEVLKPYEDTTVEDNVLEILEVDDMPF